MKRTTFAAVFTAALIAFLPQGGAQAVPPFVHLTGGGTVAADDRHAAVVKRTLIPAVVLTCASARREGLSYTDLDLAPMGIYVQVSCFSPRE